MPRSRKAQPIAIPPDFLWRWRVALAAGGLTLKAWADLHRVTGQHVTEVLHGRRKSHDILAKAIAFVMHQERQTVTRIDTARKEEKLSALQSAA